MILTTGATPPFGKVIAGSYSNYAVRILGLNRPVRELP